MALKQYPPSFSPSSIVAAGLQMFGWILHIHTDPQFTLSTEHVLAGSMLKFCRDVVDCSDTGASLKIIDNELRSSISLESLFSVCFYFISNSQILLDLFGFPKNIISSTIDKCQSCGQSMNSIPFSENHAIMENLDLIPRIIERGFPCVICKETATERSLNISMLSCTSYLLVFRNPVDPLAPLSLFVESRKFIPMHFKLLSFVTESGIDYKVNARIKRSEKLCCLSSYFKK